MPPRLIDLNDLPNPKNGQTTASRHPEWKGDASQPPGVNSTSAPVSAKPCRNGRLIPRASETHPSNPSLRGHPVDESSATFPEPGDDLHQALGASPTKPSDPVGQTPGPAAGWIHPVMINPSPARKSQMRQMTSPTVIRAYSSSREAACHPSQPGQRLLMPISYTNVQLTFH
ncbi:uncharacterized protein BO80DRAFT_123580 [Aspergillus ibericus CBS 121593]|uniref:Uncharacterized protein n=1 Tax=Aspergillus ibericus CBS 121593 TaxID=1448316 RepID=A0A395GZG9_9EURO|nr:hypothetical protein BO80DRAFT_123580 [Aspergillus ibericus CBS 121593]RAK99423.1 hypothetical protein BO80DRAFT_123580 [Aspergillus ibericus CBS 121593]